MEMRLAYRVPRVDTDETFPTVIAIAVQPPDRYAEHLNVVTQGGAG